MEMFCHLLKTNQNEEKIIKIIKIITELFFIYIPLLLFVLY